MRKHFIIDFDSTFVKIEALDMLASISLADNPKKDQITKKIEKITRDGMEGKISFPTSLSKRLALFKTNKTYIKELILVLEAQITDSILRNKDFFKTYSDSIYIISGGFKDYIVPIVREFGIPERRVLANTFTYDTKGNVTGFDKKSLLAQEKGKVKQLEKLNLKGDVCIVGDGMTDFQMREGRASSQFYAFVENVRRDVVMEKADVCVFSFDELLYHLDLPRKLSFPKSKMKVLLLENIHQNAVKNFESQGYKVEQVKGALSEKELIEKITDSSIIGIRSKTEITEKVLKNAHKLLAIGAFCIGTNQIDLSAASQKGIAVFNAPYSNTRSVVELVISYIVMLARQVPQKNKLMHEGVWDKSAQGSVEVRGKTLGIIGYGNIGTQLSVLAENLGMQVVFYDIEDKLALGNARKMESIEELLHNSDVVTVHVDGRKSNTNLIGKREFGQMREGVIFMNLSRGFVVDIEALVTNLKSGKIKGAAVDVFPKEPKSNAEKFVSPLTKFENVILTPHIGGSTQEAQENIGTFVSEKISEYIDKGNTRLSVNFPQISLPQLSGGHRLLHVHENVPGVLAAINTVLANNNLNIVGQYLKTNEEIGYVITDVEANYDKTVMEELKNVPGTISLRVLY